jgi:formamidopyrimidine-DNA glycosylase
MPELPEVETVRRTLEKRIIGKKIKNVSIFYKGHIRNKTPEQFKHSLQGRVITSIKRYGKNLMFVLDENLVLLIHLRMEGKFYLKQAKEERDKHEHILFHFTDGSDMRYHDVRKFGTMDIYHLDNIMDEKPLQKLGKEAHAADLDGIYLKNKLSSKTRPIKSSLLDQSVIAGLGNIYVDEVLFRCKLHPQTPCNVLHQSDFDHIATACKEVLQKAIDLGGTTIRSYTSSLGVTGRFQNELLIHMREGEKCYHCNDTIQKIRVGGRGTYFCPTCQKLPK